MKRKEFDESLRSLLRQQPFQPFLVEMVEGEKFTVDAADAVACNRGAAGFISADREVHFFDYRSVRRFVTAARESA